MPRAASSAPAPGGRRDEKDRKFRGPKPREKALPRMFPPRARPRAGRRRSRRHRAARSARARSRGRSRRMGARATDAPQTLRIGPLGRRNEWRGRRGSLIFGTGQAHRKTMIARLLMALVRLYQIVLSPFLGGACRFEPSCSRYALACLEGQGALRGGLLSVRRLCKCHPFHPGGVDLPRRPIRTLGPSAKAASNGSEQCPTHGRHCGRDPPLLQVRLAAHHRLNHDAPQALALPDETYINAPGFAPDGSRPADDAR